MLFIGAIWFEFIYYQSFDIDIFSFISFSEIISLFISQIPLLLIISLMVLFLIFCLNTAFNKFFKKLIITSKHNKEQREIIRRKIFFLTCCIFIIYTILVFGPLLTSSYSFVYSEGYFFMRVIAHLIVLFWVIIPLFSTNITVSKNNLYALAFIVNFYISIYFTATFSLWKIKVMPQNRPHIRLTLNDSSLISTSDTLIFIGKTNDYIFFYNTNPKEKKPYTIVVKAENIKTINIFKNVKWFRIP